MSNIGNELVTNQNLLKLINYNTSDALSLSDLTIADIKNITGKGTDPTSQQKIYKYPFTNKVLDVAKSELRYFIPSVRPENIHLSELYINFQIVVHNSIIELDDNKLRYWCIVEELLKSLNRFDCGGIGLLYLKSSISIVSWSDYYSGYFFSMSVGSV